MYALFDSKSIPQICIYITNISLLLFRQTIPVYSENHMTFINTLLWYTMAEPAFFKGVVLLGGEAGRAAARTQCSK
jgi:hypothetical protein